MNTVYLTGTVERVLQNKVVNTKNGNKAFTLFTMKCASGKDRFDFIKVETWGDPANLVNQMPQGAFVFAEGRLRSNSWGEGNDKKFELLVTASNVAQFNMAAPQPAVQQPAVQAAPVQPAVQQVAQPAVAQTTEVIPF